MRLHKTMLSDTVKMIKLQKPSSAIFPKGSALYLEEEMSKRVGFNVPLPPDTV